VPPARPRPKPRDEDIPSVIPVPTLRGQVGELAGSMVLSAIFALLATTLWASIGQMQNMTEAGTIFFLTVATSWAVLVPSKLWAYQRGDSWRRRLVMMFLGVVVGLGALWINGWTSKVPGEATQPHESWPIEWLPGAGTALAEGAAYVIYFAVTFFALRWWRLADPRRSSRFSFLPLLAAGFWGLLPLMIWPQPWQCGAPGALVIMAAIVQLVSPWEQPAPPASRRLRLRYS